MDLQTAFLKRLKDDSAVAAIVAGKIAWGDVPQGWARPYIRLSTPSESHDEHLKGLVDLQTARVQIETFSDTYSQMMALKKAVIAASRGPSLISNIQMSRAAVDLDFDRPEQTAAGFVQARVVQMLVPYRLV